MVLRSNCQKSDTLEWPSKPPCMYTELRKATAMWRSRGLGGGDECAEGSTGVHLWSEKLKAWNVLTRCDPSYLLRVRAVRAQKESKQGNEKY